MDCYLDRLRCLTSDIKRELDRLDEDGTNSKSELLAFVILKLIKLRSLSDPASQSLDDE